MAEIFPNEGLDAIMAVFPKNGANLANLFLGFFTSQTNNTVPGATAVLATQTGMTEATGTAYARTTMAAASWGAQAAGTPDGRKSTFIPVVTPTVGAGGWGTINGFFLATLIGAGTGVAIYSANFDDVTAIVTGAGDVITVTPFINFGA